MSRLPSSTRVLAVRHTARRPWRRAEPSAAWGVAHPPGLSISAARARVTDTRPRPSRTQPLICRWAVRRLARAAQRRRLPSPIQTSET